MMAENVCGDGGLNLEKGKDMVFKRDVFATADGEMLEGVTARFEDLSVELSAGDGGVVEIETGQTSAVWEDNAKEQVESIWSLGVGGIWAFGTRGGGDWLSGR